MKSIQRLSYLWLKLTMLIKVIQRKIAYKIWGKFSLISKVKLKKAVFHDWNKINIKSTIKSEFYSKKMLGTNFTVSKKLRTWEVDFNCHLLQTNFIILLKS